MEYRESLPLQCPPEGATDQNIVLAYRAVMSNPPKAACFDSQAKRNRPLSELGDPCRHASCSLFTCREKATNIAGRLPKPRDGGPYIASMTIPTGAGRSLIKKQHVDLWFYKDFDPTIVVVAVETV